MPLLQTPIHRLRCSSAARGHVPHQQQIVRPIRPRYQLQQQWQQQQQCRCSADSAGAAAAADAADAEAVQQQQQLEDMQQPASMTVPRPVTSEPPQEESKKLSPGARLSETLASTSTSITIIGDDTELNWAVCQALAKKIGWFPVSTAKILTGMHKAGSIQEIVEKQGRTALAEAEAGVLKGMKDQFRVCVATVGDGAAADPNLYDYMYGSIIIWMDEVDKRNPKPPSAARQVYHGRSEVRAALSVATGGFSDKSMTLEEKADKATGQLIKAMNQLLKEHDYLPAKKRLYVEYGCRGDWPELKPKEWNPVLENLQRKPVPEA